ncbi:MAG TPA: DUF1549 and DUF1553 domain-containing protein, partial [Gemmataceae bacterium]|nr:DUF1549 and DUF1553 domain-containing protein [Gemmataceae bacterium]
QAKIDVLTRWVKAGVPWTPGATTAETAKPKAGEVTAEARNYWAYRPVRRPDVPKVEDVTWVRNPIDAFLLAKLEPAGLKPASPAEFVALVRRAYYDLFGLPPTPEQVDAFVNDRSPEAYEKLIDRLLESPHYGEKWGRHWLDVVRYAETNGYERDGPKPHAWRYRDYVVGSFNDDKPYDQFVREQIAGDELGPSPTPTGGNPWAPASDAIIATGYYRLGLWDDEPADPLQARYDGLDDIVATTAQTFLAMTMNCARCHDHKIDPIPQADYYRLLAFFQDVRPYSNDANVSTSSTVRDIAPPEVQANYAASLRQREARVTELQAATRKIEDEAIRKMPAVDQREAEGPQRIRIIEFKLPAYLTAEQKAEYANLQKELEPLKNKPGPPRRLALAVNNCLVQPPATHVMIRGNAHAPGTEVSPAFPSVLGFPAPALSTAAKHARSSGRRTVLANWLASPDNPLTARVMVNRIWQHHFGRGIVPTPNDFGKFGQPPTHPELLDWLADEFVRGGWRIKRMHKLVMLSNAYRMSSNGDTKALRLDPANALFWRLNMRRLGAEEVRDSFLAVSGRLNLKMGGPSVYPPIPHEVLHGQSMPGHGWGNSSPEEASRRSVYVHVKRSLLVPILSQHDQADTDSSCPVRYTTTVPTQALGMLNGAFANEQAAALAERLQREANGDVEGQVRLAIRLTTGRAAKDDELRRDVEFIRSAGSKQYCLMLLNANEFVYLD